MVSPTAHVLGDRADADPARGFTGPRDFFRSVIAAQHARDRDSVHDSRLRELSVREGGATSAPLAFCLPLAFTPRNIRAAAGSDEQGTYAAPFGGFAVVSPDVTSIALGAIEADPTAGRTLTLPMLAPELKVLARTDKDHSTSVSGGLEVVRTTETVSRASTRMTMEVVSLKASSLFGFAFATEELLDAGPAAFAAILAAGFGDEFAGTLLREKLTGLAGKGEYEGVLNAACKIEVAKESGQAADTINSTNIIKMRARCWGFSRSIWLANHDTFEQLAVLALAVGTGGSTSLYQPSNREDLPDFLAGRPIFFTEFVPTLGDAGDIVLADWSQYLEGVYQPLQSAESVHVRFVEHERAVKFWTRNAGGIWWRSALTPREGANTLSPIVTLAARS